MHTTHVCKTWEFIALADTRWRHERQPPTARHAVTRRQAWGSYWVGLTDAHMVQGHRSMVGEGRPTHPRTASDINCVQDL